MAKMAPQCILNNGAQIMRIVTVLTACLLMSGCTTLGTTISTISKAAHLNGQDRTLGGAVDDAVIETTINHRYFRTDVNDLFKNVDADVIEGRAFLTGNVDRHESMVRAVDLAWEVQGVREVINEIQVENTSDVIDAAQDLWIETQIQGELLITQGIKNSNYNVEAVNGIVTLMGIAQNHAELDKVAQIAARTANVTQVVSHVIMTDDPRRIVPKAEKPVVHYE